jgi:hypothetical protein
MNKERLHSGISTNDLTLSPAILGPPFLSISCLCTVYQHEGSIILLPKPDAQSPPQNAVPPNRNVRTIEREGLDHAGHAPERAVRDYYHSLGRAPRPGVMKGSKVKRPGTITRWYSRITTVLHPDDLDLCSP